MPHDGTNQSLEVRASKESDSPQGKEVCRLQGPRQVFQVLVRRQQWAKEKGVFSTAKGRDWGGWEKSGQSGMGVGWWSGKEASQRR